MNPPTLPDKKIQSKFDWICRVVVTMVTKKQTTYNITTMATK